MNITACSQLKSHIWPYFQLNSENYITAFDWRREQLLVRIIGRFEKWGFHSLISSLCPVRLLWWKGGRKEDHATTVLHKQTIVFWVGFTGRPLPWAKCLLFDWFILVLLTSFVKIIYLLFWNITQVYLAQDTIIIWYCWESHKSE